MNFKISPFDSNTKNYAFYGACFGFCFPLIASWIWSRDFDCNLWEAQTKHGHPLLWIIDTAPFFLGLFASFAGIKQDRIERELEIEKNKQIEQAKFASLGVMSSGLAHELRNPLSVLAGYNSIIKKQVIEDKIDREKMAEFTTKIEAAVDRILKIINGLKLFSRNSSNDPFENKKINSIIQSTLDFCEDKILQHNIKLDLVMDQECEISCHESEISQVILNLITNSIDAIENLREKWIKLKVYKVNHQLKIHIIDSGLGIPEQILDKIFDPFYTTKPVGKGTGLGLGICMGIIKTHQGELHYQEENGHTGFLITLPSI